jgi:hypothetical protein
MIKPSHSQERSGAKLSTLRETGSLALAPPRQQFP